MSPETGRRLLAHPKLKPWRPHVWLSPQTPRDAEFCARVAEVVERYTRRRRADARVLSLEEKTSLPPRPRRHATRPAQPGRPQQVEHADRRAGALHRFAAFDTRTGCVYGQGDERKRPREFIAFLASLEMAIPAPIKTSHLLCDHARAHTGKAGHAWLKAPPRVVIHFTPGHCSWLNQVEPWVSILHRKRLRIVDFASKADLEAKLLRFIAEWNDVAHPFNWTTKSVAKVMAEAMPAAA